MALRFMKLRKCWWVDPYLRVVSFLLWHIEPMVDAAWLNRLAQRQATFIGRRGYYVVFTDEDPGEQ